MRTLLHIAYVLLLLPGAGSAQAGGSAARVDTLRLEDCYDAARAHFPLRPQADLHRDLAALAVRSIRTRLLPRVSADGQALYQSDVPELPFDAPGLSAPEISKDQYKVSVNVEQLIYDGGLASVQQEIERLRGEAAVAKVDVALHDYLGRVENAFFSVLLRQVAETALAAHWEDVQARRAAVRAQADEGLLTAGLLDALDVELLRVEQQIDEAQARRLASLQQLGDLTGLEASDDDVLVAPDSDVEPLHRVEPLAGRPEIRVFALQREHLNRQRTLAGRRYRPSISSFASAAYGRPPGMDIFENNISPYYSLGVVVRWPLWDWRSSRRDQHAAELRQALIGAEQNAFSQRIRTAAEQAWLGIERLRRTVESDREIIALRERISERAEEQLSNGVISATEYIHEKQAEHQARLARERHRIELGHAKVRYLRILGGRDEVIP